MESSTVLAFRIFVMLSCLIIVPLAAIFGSAFPEVVKTQLVDRIVALGTGKPVESAPADAPAAALVEGAPAQDATRAGGADWEAPRWSGNAPASNSAWPHGSQNTSSAVVHAGAEVPQPSTRTNWPHAAEPPHGNLNHPGANSPGANQSAPNQPGPAGNTAPVDPAAQRAMGADAMHARSRNMPPAAAGYPAQQPSGSPQPLESPDRFTAMERKLREYGASYYLLETWGNEGELYRFHCRMTMSNNPNYTRHFEATDRDALKAMSQVLERVEAWRLGRLP